MYSAKPFNATLLTIPSFHTIPIEDKIKPIEVLNNSLNNGLNVESKIKYFNTVKPLAICLGNSKQLVSKGVTDLRIDLICVLVKVVAPSMVVKPVFNVTIASGDNINVLILFNRANPGKIPKVDIKALDKVNSTVNNVTTGTAWLYPIANFNTVLKMNGVTNVNGLNNNNMF